MPRKRAEGTRERILDVATRLFDGHGIHAVGLQQVIDECGCGKNVLYREFASKDDLVAAYLDRCRAGWAAIVDTARDAAPGDPAGELVALVRTVAEKATEPGTRGCALRNTHAEFPDPDHPAHQVAVTHFTSLREHLNTLAGAAGAEQPDQLADRVMLIIDGLYANGAVLGSAGASTAAVDFATEVVNGMTASPDRYGSGRVPASKSASISRV